MTTRPDPPWERACRACGAPQQAPGPRCWICGEALVARPRPRAATRAPARLADAWGLLLALALIAGTFLREPGLSVTLTVAALPYALLQLRKGGAATFLALVLVLLGALVTSGVAFWFTFLVLARADAGTVLSLGVALATFVAISVVAVRSLARAPGPRRRPRLRAR